MWAGKSFLSKAVGKEPGGDNHLRRASFLLSVFPQDTLAAAVGGQEVGPIDDQDEAGCDGGAGRRVHPAHLGNDRVGRRHTHRGMDHRQGQGEEEGQEHLGEYGPAAHLLRGAQPGQNAVTGGVVRRLGELLEGQHCRRREKKDHAQIEPHEEDQDLGTHIFHIHPDPGAQVEGGLLRVEVGEA